MRASHPVFAAVLALLCLTTTASPAAAACRLTPLVDALEAALDAAATALTAEEREAARAEAARRIESGGDGTVDTELYLMSRREALAALAGAQPLEAAERLARFDLARLAPRLDAEAATGGCAPEAERESAAKDAGAAKEGLGQRIEAPAAGRGEGGRAEAPSLAETLAAIPADLMRRASDAPPLALLAGVAGLLLAPVAVRRFLRRRRLEGRYICHLPAQVKPGAIWHSVTIADFSRNGVKVSAPHLNAAEGDRMEIEYLGVERMAMVRWSRNGNTGLRLDSPLTDEEFEQVLSAAQEGAGAFRTVSSGARAKRRERFVSPGPDHSAAGSFSSSLPVA
ncbi:MAG: PilZ domain-containing protein [Pikeienuella sp.]|uniref:PilZ domain-containing protein n=1 Tax=Pikeienuella sp. TaxID=2831957 RepID=UPI00391CE587